MEAGFAKALVSGLREFSAPFLHPLRWLDGEDLSTKVVPTLAKDAGIAPRRLAELRSTYVPVPGAPVPKDAEALGEAIKSMNLGDLANKQGFRGLSLDSRTQILKTINESLAVGRYATDTDFTSQIARAATSVPVDFNERYIFGIRLLDHFHGK